MAEGRPAENTEGVSVIPIVVQVEEHGIASHVVEEIGVWFDVRACKDIINGVFEVSRYHVVEVLVGDVDGYSTGI